MTTAINARQETLPGIAAEPASCDVLSVGQALQLEVGLSSATLPCAGHSVCWRSGFHMQQEESF